MEFLMSMLAPADQLGEAAPAEVVAAVGAFGMCLAADGKLRDGRQLRDGGFRVEPVEDAGRIVDGPFAEAKELIGGYFVVECDSVDEAQTQEAAELFRALAADAPTEQQRRLYQRRLTECAGA